MGAHSRGWPNSDMGGGGKDFLLEEVRYKPGPEGAVKGNLVKLLWWQRGFGPRK